jgi:hypothetical protein
MICPAEHSIIRLTDRRSCTVASFLFLVVVYPECEVITMVTDRNLFGYFTPFHKLLFQSMKMAVL